MEKESCLSTAAQNALGYFEIRGDFLYIEGKSIGNWAAAYGTPLYLYDLNVVRQKILRFRRAFPDDVNLYYAVKANPNPQLLTHIRPLVDGFDVASAGELEAVLAAGADPETVSFAGPGKRRDELLRAIVAGIGSINVESERELELVAELGGSGQRPARVSLRINPDYEVHGSGMKMGGGAKPFGIDAEVAPKVLKKLERLPVEFQGFHIYAGSQNLHAEVLAESIERSLELMARLAEHVSVPVKSLNLGGGFGIPYYDGERELDLELLGRRVGDVLAAFRGRFPGARFIIELGRYLVGECGIYLAQVLYRKVSRGKTFLVLDGGMNHHLAASGNFGQILRKNFPLVAPERLGARSHEKVDVVGPLCTPLDLLGAGVSLPELGEGDLVGILCSGAYGYSASPVNFLSHPLPTEVFAGPSEDRP